MQVNLDEGVRRLSLVAGAVGATFSLFWVAEILNSALSQNRIWNLALIPVPLLLGFCLPWVMVRALGWAVSGFFRSHNR